MNLKIQYTLFCMFRVWIFFRFVFVCAHVSVWVYDTRGRCLTGHWIPLNQGYRQWRATLVGCWQPNLTPLGEQEMLTNCRTISPVPTILIIVWREESLFWSVCVLFWMSSLSGLATLSLNLGYFCLIHLKTLSMSLYMSLFSFSLCL